MIRKLLFTFCLLALCNATAVAAPVFVDKLNGVEPILYSMTWLPDHAGQFSISTVADPAMQKNFHSLKNGFGAAASGKGWLRLDLAKSAPGQANKNGALLRLGALPPGQNLLYFKRGAAQIGSRDEWVNTPIKPYETIRLPEPGFNGISLFFSMEETPGLWFSPTISSDTGAKPFLPPDFLLPGILLACIAGCLLRAFGDRAIWPLWAVFVLACALVQTLCSLPVSGKLLEYADLPALLAPGLCLIVIPHLGRLLLHTRSLSLTRDTILKLLPLIGVCVCLSPLLPGYAWLTRLFPLWGLLLLPLLPFAISALSSRKQGAFSFLAISFMPILGSALALAFMGSDSIHAIVQSGAVWGVAIGGIALALTKTAPAAYEAYDLPPHKETPIELTTPLAFSGSAKKDTSDLQDFPTLSGFDNDLSKFDSDFTQAFDKPYHTVPSQEAGLLSSEKVGSTPTISGEISSATLASYETADSTEGTTADITSSSLSPTEISSESALQETPAHSLNKNTSSESSYAEITRSGESGGAFGGFASRSFNEPATVEVQPFAEKNEQASPEAAYSHSASLPDDIQPAESHGADDGTSADNKESALLQQAPQSSSVSAGADAGSASSFKNDYSALPDFGNPFGFDSINQTDHTHKSPQSSSLSDLFETSSALSPVAPSAEDKGHSTTVVHTDKDGTDTSLTDAFQENAGVAESVSSLATNSQPTPSQAVASAMQNIGLKLNPHEEEDEALEHLRQFDTVSRSVFGGSTVYADPAPSDSSLPSASAMPHEANVQPNAQKEESGKMPWEKAVPPDEAIAAMTERSASGTKPERIISLEEDLDDLDGGLDEFMGPFPHKSTMPMGKSYLFNPQILVREVHKAVLPLARNKGILLSWYSSPNLPALLVGDVPSLRQSLTLLLQNAVLATQTGAVQLSVRNNPKSDESKQGNILFSVSDTGVAQRADAGFFHAWELAERTGGSFSIDYVPHGGTLVNFSANFTVPEESELTEFEQAIDMPATDYDAIDEDQSEEFPLLNKTLSALSARKKETDTPETSAPATADVSTGERVNTPSTSTLSYPAVIPGRHATLDEALSPINEEEPAESDEFNLSDGKKRIILADLTTSNKRLLTHYFSQYPVVCLDAGDKDQVIDYYRKVSAPLIIYDADSPEDIVTASIRSLSTESQLSTAQLVLIGHEAQGERMFAAGASDVLLKPFSQEDFLRAVLRLVPSLATAGTPAPVADVPQPVQQEPKRLRVEPEGIDTSLNNIASLSTAQQPLAQQQSDFQPAGMPAQPSSAHQAPIAQAPTQQSSPQAASGNMQGQSVAPLQGASPAQGPATVVTATTGQPVLNGSSVLTGQQIQVSQHMPTNNASAMQSQNTTATSGPLPSWADEAVPAQPRTRVVPARQAQGVQPLQQTQQQTQQAGQAASAQNTPQAGAYEPKTYVQQGVQILSLRPADMKQPGGASHSSAQPQQNSQPRITVSQGPHQEKKDTTPLMEYFVTDEQQDDAPARQRVEAPRTAAPTAVNQATRPVAPQTGSQVVMPQPAVAGQANQAGQQAGQRAGQTVQASQTNTAISNAFPQEDYSGTVALPDIDDEFIERIMLPLLPGLLHTLQDAVSDAVKGRDEGHSLLVQEAANRLSGKASVFGLVKLAKIANCVERAAQAEDVEAINTLLEDLLNVTKRYIESLKKCYENYMEQS